jgi:hypothetical protein
MKTKTCTICKILKPIAEFDFTKSKPNGQSYCSACRRNWMQKHYKKHKREYKAKAIEAKRRRRELINSLKARPCSDCKQSYPPYVMDFDHISNKSFNIGNNIDLSKDKVLKEISKCDLVCANCHRLRTHKHLSAS